jgi:hypothetical protein
VESLREVLAYYERFAEESRLGGGPSRLEFERTKEVADFESRWTNAVRRDDMMAVARAMEAEPSTLGVSAHLLGIGKKAR